MDKNTVMKSLKATALFLVLATLSMAAQAGLVTWDFEWERNYGTDIFSGTGMFSYDSSAGERVTQGGFFMSLPDELTAFSFNGFVNGSSIGGTNAMPEYFNFSPGVADLTGSLGVIWGLSANGFFFGQGAGVGCIWNFCGLTEDGSWVGETINYVSLTMRGGIGSTGGGGTTTTSLAEPGTLGLTGLGMLLGGLITRRRKKN